MTEETPRREPIFMISTEGKTEDQVVEEAWAAIQAHQQAEAEGTEFQPVLDLRPEHDPED